MTAWDDKEDAMTPDIKADFDAPGFHDRYAKALELVGNRYSKGSLVAMTAYLLKFLPEDVD